MFSVAIICDECDGDKAGGSINLKAHDNKTGRIDELCQAVKCRGWFIDDKRHLCPKHFKEWRETDVGRAALSIIGGCPIQSPEEMSKRLIEKDLEERRTNPSPELAEKIRNFFHAQRNKIH